MQAAAGRSLRPLWLHVASCVAIREQAMYRLSVRAEVQVERSRPRSPPLSVEEKYVSEGVRAQPRFRPIDDCINAQDFVAERCLPATCQLAT